MTVVGLGVIEPALTFSVKSKAWGEILQMPVQTGDEMHKNQLLASIDPRIPQANLTEAQATVEKTSEKTQHCPRWNVVNRRSGSVHCPKGWP